MKKLITLTSILAAGTLCASAATTLTTSFSYSNSTVNATNSDTSITSAISAKYLYGQGDPASASWITSTSGYDTNVITPWISIGAKTSRQINGSTVNNILQAGWQITNTYSTTSGTSVGSSVGVIDSISVVLVALKKTDGTGTSSDNPATVEALTSATGSNYPSVTVTATVYNGTQELGSFTSSDSWNLNSSKTEDLAAHSMTLTGTAIDVSSASDLKVVLEVKTATSCSGSFIGLKTMSIPEPSMFGLLAGTLALGLAGTRRRRGK